MKINIPIYKNKEFFKLIYPNTNMTELDFEELNSPLTQFFFLTSSIDKKDLKNYQINFCYIDEHFKEFLDSHNFEDGKIGLQVYLENLQQAQIEQLWEMSDYKRNVELYILSFFIKGELKKVTNYELNDEQKQLLLEEISKKTNIPVKNIFIPKYINYFDILLKYAPSLLHIGESYLYENQKIIYQLMNEQVNNSNTTNHHFGIPIMIRNDIPSQVEATFIDKFLSEKPFTITMDKDILNKVIDIEGLKSDLESESLISYNYFINE